MYLFYFISINCLQRYNLLLKKANDELMNYWRIENRIEIFDFTTRTIRLSKRLPLIN